MFNFTKTTFVHSSDLFKAKPNGTKGTFWADGNLFRKDQIAVIFRNPYIAPVNGKLIIDVTGLMENETDCNAHYRLNFYIRRTGDVNGYYANDYVFKGKDFHYEWTGKVKTAKDLTKIIKGVNKLYGDIYLKVYTGSGTPDQNYIDEVGNLVIETDNYGLITEATIEKWVETEADCCVWRDAGHWEVIDELGEGCLMDADEPCEQPGNYTPKVVVKKSYAPSCSTAQEGYMRALMCVNGTGTYEQVMKDLRLPTAENLRWMSPNAKEMPIPGNKYAQYTIHMISCRGILGGSAVGEVTHSKTTHVFFVPTCGCNDGDLDAAFYNALETSLGPNIVKDAPHDDPVAQRDVWNNVDFMATNSNIAVAKATSADSGSESDVNDKHGFSDDTSNSETPGGQEPNPNNQEPANP